MLKSKHTLIYLTGFSNLERSFVSSILYSLYSIEFRLYSKLLKYVVPMNVLISITEIYRHKRGNYRDKYYSNYLVSGTRIIYVE